MEQLLRTTEHNYQRVLLLDDQTPVDNSDQENRDQYQQMFEYLPYSMHRRNIFVARWHPLDLMESNQFEQVF
jgi:hypothetical protein